MPGANKPSKQTAHDRLKASFWSYVWGATVFSALLHFAVLATARVTIDDGYAINHSGEMEQVELQRQEYEIPPPPAQISRPAVPVLSTDINISDDITIGEIVFNQISTESLPPPPALVSVDVADEPAFTPYEVRPSLRNSSELQDMLLKLYPPLLKRAGIGGIAILWIFIDETGIVQNTKVVESSGYEELDLAAQKAVREVARFTPAMNRDARVPVWIQMPIQFVSTV